MMRSLFKRMTLIIALAVITGAVLHGPSIYSLWQNTAVHDLELYSPQPVERSFVQQWVQKGQLIVDARSHSDYLNGHIGRAHSVPAGDGQRLHDVVACCVDRQQVLVYCSSVSCSDSFTVGEALFVAGFTQVYLYEGGFADWQQGQHNTEATLDEQGGQ